jgi:hypothetical protein
MLLEDGVLDVKYSLYQKNEPKVKAKKVLNNGIRRAPARNIDDILARVEQVAGPNIQFDAAAARWFGGVVQPIPTVPEMPAFPEYAPPPVNQD